MAKQPVRQSLRQGQPLPPEWQVCDPCLGFDTFASRCHHLEATVQNERVNAQSATTDGARDGYFAQRFAGPGPERLQRSERGAEIDPNLGLGMVIGGQIHRCHLSLERCRIHRRGS